MSAYARQAVARSGSGWTVASGIATLTSLISFPLVASGSATVTHCGVGKSVSGTGELLFFGAVTPNITIAAGVTPKLDTGTNVTQANSDGMANSAANDLMLLLFNNTTWAGIGDTTGIVGSTSAGSLYLSLHTSSPGEGGSQTTNEATYS